MGILKQGLVAALTELVAGTPLRHVFLRSRQSRVVIFTIHRVADPKFEIPGHLHWCLERTLERLRRLDVPTVGLMDVFQAQHSVNVLPPISVCFTLDDGYWDQADVTLPLLLAHDAKPSTFLITGFLDGTLWPWDSRVKEFFRLAPRAVVKLDLGERRATVDCRSPASKAASLLWFTELCRSASESRREDLIAALASGVDVCADLPVPAHHRPMTWDRVRELERQGVRFGSHSISHSVFSGLSDDTAGRELVGSHQRLRSEVREPLPIIAWPIGRQSDFGERDLRLARQAGYSAAVNVFARDCVLSPGRSVPGFPVFHRHGFVNHPTQALTMVFGFRRALSQWINTE